MAMDMTFVYVIEDGAASTMKIGTTTNVVSRLATLQTGSSNELQFVAILRTFRSGSSIETLAHNVFASHRLRGEWFSACDEIRNLGTNSAIATSIDAAEQEWFDVISREQKEIGMRIQIYATARRVGHPMADKLCSDLIDSHRDILRRIAAAMGPIEGIRVDKAGIVQCVVPPC